MENIFKIRKTLQHMNLSFEKKHEIFRISIGLEKRNIKGGAWFIIPKWNANINGLCNSRDISGTIRSY